MSAALDRTLNRRAFLVTTAAVGGGLALAIWLPRGGRDADASTEAVSYMRWTGTGVSSPMVVVFQPFKMRSRRSGDHEAFSDRISSAKSSAPPTRTQPCESNRRSFLKRFRLAS